MQNTAVEMMVQCLNGKRPLLVVNGWMDGDTLRCNGKYTASTDAPRLLEGSFRTAVAVSAVESFFIRLPSFSFAHFTVSPLNYFILFIHFLHACHLQSWLIIYMKNAYTHTQTHITLRHLPTACLPAPAALKP